MNQSQTIGIIGGGQLGRMLTQSALSLGYKVVVVDAGPGSPASQVGAEQIVGDLYDTDALQSLAEKSDFITIEIEHLDASALEALAALGKPINPAPATIRLIQDKLAQKEFLHDNDVPVAPYLKITDADSAEQALRLFSGQIVIKTRYGAYDGRGNMVVKSSAGIKKALDKFKDQKLYAEQFIPFVKELSVVVARSVNGDIRVYPIVETVHERNICVEVLAPADIGADQRAEAEQVALQVARQLDGAGVFAIEMFLTDTGEILVNEIAPRVHNSGHYTIESNRTSQFEQHIRAITGLPLGETDLIVPAAVMINILGERDGPTQLEGLGNALRIPHTSVHVYGKSPTKIDRKMGHVTATGATLKEARARAVRARKKLSI